MRSLQMVCAPLKSSLRTGFDSSRAGNLNPRILDLMRMSEIDSIDLTASMTDEEGLNLDARVLLHGVQCGFVMCSMSGS